MTITELERLAVVETKIDIIGVKLDRFIDCADEKYASKERVDEIEDSINRDKEVSRGWVQWIPAVITSLAAIIIIFI